MRPELGSVTYTYSTIYSCLAWEWDQSWALSHTLPYTAVWPGNETRARLCHIHILYHIQLSGLGMRPELGSVICASCHGSTLPSQTFRTTLVCPTGVLCLHSSATRLMTLRSWVSVMGTSCGSWTEGSGRINGGGRRMQAGRRVTYLARTLEHTSDTQSYCSQSSLHS